MIEEKEYSLGNLSGRLHDLDVTKDGCWIAVLAERTAAPATSRPNLPDHFAESLARMDARKWLSFGGREVAIPHCRFPLVRAVDGRTALVVESRACRYKPNAWVVSETGDVGASFFVGDAVQDVLVSPPHVVVTYFDEGACAGAEPSIQGVAVFDMDGHYIVGYRRMFGEEAARVYDCYAACWAADGAVLFFPYNEFPVVLWDLESRRQYVYETPCELAGCKAVTTTGEDVFFHGPYRDKESVYHWRVGAETATRVGSHSGRLRGMPGGRFLAIEEHGYRILRPSIE
jgi:hypothetical protein